MSASAARPSAPSTTRSDLGKLVILMITAFVDMIGVLMVIPLLPFYVKALGGGGFDVGGYHLGVGQITALLVSAFTVAQLVSAPLWGRFSDRYGRRPALVIALAASAAAYVIFGFATSLVLLFVSRLVQGAGGGTTGVIQAYVADATRPEDRAKSLGWLSAATNAGVALGPVIGSWSSHVSHKAPGLIAAALCTVNIVFAWTYLKEAREPGTAGAQKGEAAPRRSGEAVVRVVTHPAESASRLIWIYAVAIGAFQGVNSILALFLATRYGVTATTIGYFFAYVGVLSVVTRAFLLSWMIDRFGEARLSRLGIVLLVLGLGTLPLTHALWQLAIAVALMPLGAAFTFPCVTAMLSRVVAGGERGLYMGVQQTFGGASRALFPVVAGFAFDRLGVGVPFVIAAVVVASTLLLGFDLESYVPRRPQAAAG
ncbi:tetracycline resistance MFS efflux pump [Gemmatimonadetes bacterium T265]|nr:tetracycline resistance MFS efflux pump [Gemmatimonadetes bacterium T265]